MNKKSHTFRHRRPSSALWSLLTGWRKMKFEDIPVGATFVCTNVGGKDHACVLLENWTVTPVADSEAGLVKLTARCRSWHVLGKGYPEEEYDHTEPYRFLKGRKTWVHIPKA